ncbi:MAG TPA: hypothetical protein VNU94_04300 [Acidobacteriaceae bacterium]|jgi:hypothetical protein|nr:hypothetical protein [Acidobacteriaceae bacterium]
MKAVTLVGALLIVLGLAGLFAGGFTYTHQKKDVDMGPIQISHQQTRTVPIPPLLGGLALAGGIGLVVAGAKKD